MAYLSSKRQKRSSVTPERQAFTSFRESSPEDSALHIFDSPRNKQRRDDIFTQDCLTIPDVELLEDLWKSHCPGESFPGLQDLPMVAEMRSGWAARTTKLIHEAMPDYRRKAYTLSQNMIMETVQQRWMMKVHRAAAVFCVEGMSGM